VPHQLEKVKLRDGRELEYLVEGDPDGFPLVMHHGTPGSGVTYPQLSRACREHGLSLVMYTRAGYGTSTPRPDRRVADVTDDVADLLDHLGHGEFLTLGWSGGGPHALACAARLPDRCLAAATGAGAAPYETGGRLDFLADMGPENIKEFGAALEGRSALEPYLERERAELLESTPETIGEALGGLVSPVDKAYAHGEFAEHLFDSFSHALSLGIEGWAEDDLAFTRPWGFELEEIDAVPVSVWQGREDRMVPFAHGEHLASRLPTGRAHLYDDEGHLSLMARVGDVVADLRERAGL
jgi:pimeloyl-ACP methyl ester carboxylesterase